MPANVSAYIAHCANVTIKWLAERGIITFPPVGEVSNTGFGPKALSVYWINKRDSYVIVEQLSWEFTARLVDRWQELKEAKASVPHVFALTQTLAQALRFAADQAEQIEQ